MAAIVLFAAIAGWITCSNGGGGGKLASTDEPIERRAPADGWDTIDVPPLDDTYTLTASDDSGDGIARDTAFALESAAADLDADALRSLLVVDPPVDFDIDGGGARITLRPHSPLREGTRYRFALHSASDGRQLRSWAFQTVSPLRIVQTLPANRATNVPLDTGIELTFSHDGVSDIADRFSMTPPVEGRFEMHKRVAVFVPKALAPETLYTVTLGAGVRAGDELETTEPSAFAFETGSALRGESPPAFDAKLYFSRLVFEASTIEPAMMQLDVCQPVTAIRLPVEVFRYDSDDGFTQAIRDANAVPYWSLYTRKRFRLDPSGLDRVATFDVDAAQFGTNSCERFIALPEPLEPGFYLVQAEYERETVQALLQVTDLAAYASVSTSKTLVWVNDLASGAPVEGAGVRDDDGDSHMTNSDGVAMFETPVSRALGSAASDFLRVGKGGRSAILSFHGQVAIGYYGFSQYDQRGYGGYYPGYPYGSGSPEYWSYFYPDRTLYRPSDEIRFWGVAKKREDFVPGATLTARLGGGGYSKISYGASELSEADVSVSDLGTFAGSLRFEGVAPGSYPLSIVSGDETIAASYIQVENFIKPAYRIESAPSRRAVYAGEELTFDIRSEFFDGSPVPFVGFTYNGPEEGGSPRAVSTDADGVASIPYVGQSYGPFGGPAYRSMGLYPTGPEQSEIYVNATVYVLPSALTVTAEGEVDDGRATITGSVHDVDLGAFNDGESGDWYRGYEGAASAGRAVTANVVERRYNKIEYSEDYDFIAKATRKRYRYETVERSIGTFSAVSGPDGAFSFGFPVQPDLTYIANMTVVDDAGRTGGSYAYVSGDAFVYIPYSDTRLALQQTASDPADPYSYGNTAYAPGELVDLSIRRTGDTAESGDAYRYLFVRAQNGIRDYVSATEPRLQWDYADEDVPSVSVSAVQFNGRGYEVACCDYTAHLKKEDREITVDVSSDLERYEPGSDVTLAIQTLDAAGAPVSAEVLLSLVDEAIFQLQGTGYQSSILEQLYSALPSGILATYVPSYTDVSLLQRQYVDSPNTGGSPGAAVGGPDTGPGAPRSDFRDLALFRAVRTDANGAATVTFTLPDNVTSWRVTSRAVTGDLRAGASVTAIPVGLPFFVEITAADEYLTADRPAISLRAVGRALARGDLVSYTIDAPSLGIAAASVTGEAFRGADFELPPLTEGEHEVTVRANSADRSDGIVRTLRVVASRLRRGEARFYELTPGTAIEGASVGLTRVVFSDHSRGRYYDDLLRLGWEYGDRVDQQLARALSQELLVEFFDADVEGAAAFDASLYQTGNGGIALFPYAQEELTLSARALSVAPSRFGRNALAQYFRGVFDDPDETRERAVIALWGLAASGESILPSIRVLAAANDLTPRERLYLGLAALAAGDDAGAREQYRQVVARYGERREPFVRVRAGVDQDDILELTALAADLGAGIGDPSAAAMFAYTQANRTTDLLVELDQISYLARALPLLPSEPVRFAYTLRGKRAEQSLEAGRSFYMTLTGDDLAALGPETLEGNVGIATFFEAPFDPATAVTDPDVRLTRVVDVGAGGITEGDVVQVRLDYVLSPQSLDGCYQVNDLTPSGLRPITRPQRYYDAGIENATFPYRIEGQRVSFCVYRRYLPHAPLVYFARVVTKGEYAAEPAIIQSQQSMESFNLTAAETIVIR